MIDYEAYAIALRNRALSLEVCTTGSTTLSASATGYGRSAGSFLTDGFRPGMEVLAASFGTAANNGTGVITAVATLTLTVTAYTVSGSTITSRTLVTEAGASGRTISVGFPALRAWENIDFTPPDSAKPFVLEQFIPGPVSQVTLGSLGEIEATPMYSLQVHVPKNTGLGAAYAYADALITHFAPRQEIVAGSDVLRVRTDTGPFRGQLLQTERGHAVIPVSIPTRLRTANAI